MRTVLTTARDYLARRPNLEDVQRFLTDLAALIVDTNLRSEMSNSVREQLACRSRFIAVGAVHAATINTAADFSHISTRLSNGISQIIASSDITSTLIDE